MSVADYMTTKLIVAHPDTSISVAIELMRTNDIHRLPVLADNQLVGLVTQGSIAKALPSSATSLSVYETNYLLTKATVASIMITTVQTIAATAQLEAAIDKMHRHKIGVLPVMQADRLVGIITNNDILAAFLNITDYGDNGVVTRVIIHHDRPGVIFKLGQVLAEHNLSIKTLMVVRRHTDRIIEMRVDSPTVASVNAVLTAAGFEVERSVN
ncbi:CBS domain protein [Lactobacillus zymae] [Lactiplantibacillus mudanjiangensis]|uniref:CBS and ACT domain-containing protein n=1 Tax=Lactiplantibacillus mudanjiangensis TaxID=1296538 RepID=UPI0010154A1C|nr:CBS domain protein [Lactobacillus zymae] [Lactiplantibacillus mudanjiangensis]